MGGTTKSKNKYKIGQFGTGLKYTLSYLFRNNLDFHVFTGTNEIKITTEIENIEDDIFEIICINGHRTSITTKMGEDWQAWMIVRELWCNALDEGEATNEVTTDVTGKEGYTTFYIQEDINIKMVIKEWTKYFMQDSQILWQDQNYRLYPSGNHLCIYKQGVLVMENLEEKSLYNYDILDADINELREFRGTPDREISNALINADKKVIEYVLENITDSVYEGRMDWNWFVNFTDRWKEVIGEAKIITANTLSELEARGSYPDRSRLIILPTALYQPLAKQFDSISAVYTANDGGSFYEQFSEDCENKIKQALAILETCNYPFHDQLQFKYGFFEDKRTQADINMKDKIIRVSNTLIQQPLFTFIAMLIEECEHFNTGFNDNTRAFQQHFINLYTRQLLASQQIEI